MRGLVALRGNAAATHAHQLVHSHTHQLVHSHTHQLVHSHTGGKLQTLNATCCLLKLPSNAPHAAFDECAHRARSAGYYRSSHDNITLQIVAEGEDMIADFDESQFFVE